MWSLYFVVNQRFTFLYIALRQKIIAKVSHCDKKLSLQSKVNKVKKRKEKKYIKKINFLILVVVDAHVQTRVREDFKKKGFAVMEKPRKR